MALQTPHLERMVAVGRTGAHEVRLWLRSPEAGRHTLEVWPAANPAACVRSVIDVRGDGARDHTFAFDYPGPLAEVAPLEPLTHYRFRLRAPSDVSVGEGAFQTAPGSPAQMPRRMSFGVASCHQPFDEDGTVRPRALRMLEAARRAWTDADVKFVLWVGDQLYADLPEGQSLFGEHPALFSQDTATVRALWHARYRACWSLPQWQALHASFAGYPLWDDHEIFDNFGSLPEHGTRRWQAIREGARLSYADYQHARVADVDPRTPAPWDHAFDYGSLAVYLLDLRTHRRADEAAREATMISEAQFAALEQWLRGHADAKALFLVLSVPLFFIPPWATRMVAAFPGRFRQDAHDRWSHPKFRHVGRRLLRLLHAHQRTHPDQRLVLVSGDVHIGYVMRCVWSGDGASSLYQFVSSAITHEMSKTSYALTQQVPRTLFGDRDAGFGRRARLQMMGSRLARLRQPIAALNVGIIDVDLSSDRAELGFRLIGERDGAPHCLVHARTDA